MKVIDKLAWIEIQDKTILSTRSKGKDTYYIPGGKRELGETDIQALTREIKEELSVDLIEDSIQFLGVFAGQAHGHPEGVQVKMQCYTSHFTGILQPAAEIEEMVWLRFEDIEKVSPVDKIIFQWLKERNLIN